MLISPFTNGIKYRKAKYMSWQLLTLDKSVTLLKACMFVCCHNGRKLSISVIYGTPKPKHNEVNAGQISIILDILEFTKTFSSHWLHCLRPCSWDSDRKPNCLSAGQPYMFVTTYQDKKNECSLHYIDAYLGMVINNTKLMLWPRYNRCPFCCR